MPTHIYRANQIEAGVRLVSRLQTKSLQETPIASGPLASLGSSSPLPAGPANPLGEVGAGYCLGCQDKKPFPVEGKEAVKGGYTRSFGHCAECGSLVNSFSEGAASEDG